MIEQLAQKKKNLTHSMMVFKFPKRWCMEVPSMTIQYLWGGDSKNKNIHWKKWSNMQLPKSKGGIGFEN